MNQLTHHPNSKTYPLKGVSRFIAVFIVLITSFAQRAQAQDRLEDLSRLLDSMSTQIPGLVSKSDLSLSNVPLHDYLRSIGKVHKINLYIDDMPSLIVTNNFYNEPIKNIFIFLCKKFNLTIEPVGTILNFSVYTPVTAKAEPPKPKKLNLSAEGGKVSFDLRNDTLRSVIREVSRLTGNVIISDPGTDLGLISGYMPATDFETAFTNLMFMNGYVAEKNRKGIFVVSKTGAGAVAKTQGKGGVSPNPSSGVSDYSIEVKKDTAGNSFVFLHAEAAQISRIISDLFAEVGNQFYLFEELQGNSTLSIDGEPLDEVLKNLFRGTDYTWKNDGGVYLVGKRDMEGLRATKVINLKYRPTEKVLELIPQQIKENVELKEFVELNRIIVTGSSESIREVEAFIAEIDRPVPMVKVEMMVVDVDFSRIMKTGVKAGLHAPGDSVSAVKSLFPGLNYNFTGTEVNNLLQSSGIPALMGLGALKSNFYLQLEAEETRGNLRIVTRPVISTLNGNEASITIGETDYYLLQSQIFNNGAVNNYNTVSQRYEKIDIYTTISVKPFVSHDGMVTMDITPNFTSPGKQISQSVPPSILTRKFESTIRVRDGETVVLGGLSRETNSMNSEGLPFISRVPVLRNIFGSVSRNKSKSSLIIYITPTIYYN